jgi:pyruvate dehydrogenase E2 component (dihydrolipoamide acetyltransferase)
MDIRLPRLGEGADSGTVVSVLVKEGDEIKKDQNILELENEKAVAAIPSPASGKVSQIRIKPGDKISVGQVLITLEGAVGSAAAASSAPAAQTPKAATSAPAPATKASQAKQQTSSSPAKTPSGIPLPASPSLRRMAREIGLDLSRVVGSESGGRISFEDVRSYIQRLQSLEGQPPSEGTSAPSKPAAEKIDFSKWGPVSKKPLTSLRKIIAQRMQESSSTIPHVNQFEEIDITEITELQKKYAGKYEKKGARLTLTPMILKALVATLKKHPIFNSSLDEASEEIVLKEYYHIGIAVDTEQGLIVPVLKDVDKKSILELCKDLADLAIRTRERKISGDELKGNTFTISNQGAIGGGIFTPIINKPDVAILGLARSALKPVVRGKKIEQALILPICLSYDHRVIDGGTAARFVVDLNKAFSQFTEKDLKI